MAKIQRFEELQSWQKARQLANLIYELTEHPKFAKDFRLCGQIQDASGSVMHNIAEDLTLGPILSSFVFSKYRDALQVKYNRNSISHWIENILIKMNLSKPMTWQPKPRNLLMA